MPSWVIGEISCMTTDPDKPQPRVDKTAPADANRRTGYAVRRSPGAAGDSERIRDRLRRSYLFLVLNRHPATRKALEHLIKQAEAQLSTSLSSDRFAACSAKFPGIDRKL